MSSNDASYANVTSGFASNACWPCNPCGPDQPNSDGSQCYPCNPCGPDQLGPGGSQCYPCNPCGPDQRDSDGGQCYPCNPCGPDQRGEGGSQCYPCNPCGPDQGSPDSSGDGNSSGCFITSACVNAKALPDDCYELQILRALRDKRTLYDRRFADTIKEYYRIAPKIVKRINERENSSEIYNEIYSQLVLPAVNLVKEHREDVAVELYTQFVLKLKAVYLD